MLEISNWEIKFIYNKVIKGEKCNEIKQHGAGNIQDDTPILCWFLKSATKPTKTETGDACLATQTSSR